MPMPASPAPAAAATTTPGIQRRTLTVLVLAQIVGTIGVGVAPSIGVLLAEDVTDSEVWAGLARTASTLGAALFGLPLGSLAARRGRRAALSTGWLAAAAGAALLVGASQWSSALLLFPGLVLIGIGSAVALQSRFAATDHAVPERRGRALALVVWVGTLGSVIGPNLGIPGGLISSVTGLTLYASAFLVAAAALAAAGGISLALTPGPAPTGSGVPVPARPGSNPVRELMTAARGSTRVGAAVLAILTAQVVMVSIMTMTPVHLHHHGGSVSIVGITISLHIAGMYGLAPVVGAIIDRKGARFATGIGVVVLAASLAAAALYPERQAAVVIALVLLGIGWSFTNVAGSTFFVEALPAEGKARAQGAVDALANLCGAAAAFLSGPLLALTSFSVLAVAGLVAMVPLAAAVLMRRRWEEHTGPAGADAAPAT